jgi:hypothetical protein
MSTFEFRPPEASDLNFILSSWAESFRKSPWSGALSDKLYFDSCRAHVEEVLSRPTCQVLCLVAPGEKPPHDILGYACWQPGVLHYVYVKHLFRKTGIAKSLLSRIGITGGIYTFKTRAAIEYTRGHGGWKHDPRYARYDLAEGGGRVAKVPGSGSP